MALDVRDHWNFDNPAASETIFRTLLESGAVTDRSEQLEVWAQIARTYSLRGDCPKCHELLDQQWDGAITIGGRPKGCFELERGRAFRSAKEVEKSKPFFDAAAESVEDDIKVDAMHMLAIIADPKESLRINLDALGFAQHSPSLWAQRWEGTLCNNIGWTLFDQENFSDALIYFERGLAARQKYGQAGAVSSAKWCVGRCQRAAGKLDEAFTTQMELSQGPSDGYVDEELGEILLGQGKTEDAKPYFARAVALLSEELGSDSERIQRMKSLS